MGIGAGPRIPTGNLIFGYDMENDFKSFLGAPTTNIVPDPDRNANFTTSNYWYSYNTNQYNGNSYFTIPSISSVSSNIVTTSSAHPFRTYDVCRAQTTGGGVTAGTDYFIKKVSDTQFSLHAYNSSQNGSQGYLVNNSYHKVHESIALDQRVSINATSFPTSWWGAPHLPNSACVKEIVPGGGRRPGSNSMRLHVTRTVGVGSDGMAYGVYCSVTSGDTIRVSFWHRMARGDKASVSWTTYFGSGFSATSKTFYPSEEWQRFEHTWTSSNTFNFYQYWFPTSNGAGPWAFDMCDLHVTVNESTYANFYPGTRISSQVLKDWTGTYTISNPAVTYSDRTNFYFDNADDFMDTSGFSAGTYNNMTIAAWVYDDSADTNYRSIVQHNVAGDDALYVNPSNYLQWWPATASTLTVPKNQWNFVACSHAYGSGLQYQVNSSQQFISGTFADPTDWDWLRIGGYGTTDGERWGGKIPFVLVYNRTLSARELMQLYVATRRKFQ